MPMMTEAVQVGKLQEIGDWISNIQPDTTPFVSALRSGKRPSNSLMTNQAEKYDDKGFRGVLGGQPVTTFNFQNRVLITGAVQQFDYPWAVEERAALTEVAALGRGEAQRQAVIAMIQMRRMKERAYCSNLQARVQSGMDAWETWGAFAALDPTLSGSTAPYPIPEAIRATSAQQYTSALSSFDEDDMKTLMRTAHDQKRGMVKLVGFCGSELRGIISDFTNVYKTSSSTAQPRTMFMVQGNSRWVNKVVDISTDFGDITLITTTFLLNDPDTGAASTYTTKSGLFVDETLWEDAQLLPMSPRRLPDDGSGERGYVRTFCGLRPRNTQGQFTVVTNT